MKKKAKGHLEGSASFQEVSCCCDILIQWFNRKIMLIKSAVELNLPQSCLFKNLCIELHAHHNFISDISETTACDEC